MGKLGLELKKRNQLIKDLYYKQGFSQKKLADKFDMSRQRVAQILKYNEPR